MSETAKTTHDDPVVIEPVEERNALREQTTGATESLPHSFEPSGESLSNENGAERAALSGFAFLWLHRGAVLALMDVSSIVCGFMFAYYIRFKTSILPLRPNFWRDPVKYLSMAAILAGVWVLGIWIFKGYRSGARRVDSFSRQAVKLLIAGTFATGILIVVSYFEPSIFLSRAVYLIALVAAPPLMLIVRLLFREIEKDLADMKVEVVRVVAAGLSEQSSRFPGRFSSGNALTRFVGYLGVGRDDEPDSFCEHPILGRMTDLPEIYERYPFDMLIVCSSVFAEADRPHVEESLPSIINFCENNKISVLYDLGHATDAVGTEGRPGALGGISLPPMSAASRTVPPSTKSAAKTGSRALIVGFNQKGKEILDRIAANTEQEYRVLGFVSSDPSRIGKTYRDVPVIASLADLKRTVEELGVDEVIMAFGTWQHQSLMDVVTLTKGSSAMVRLVPGIDGSGNGKTKVSRLRNLPLVPINPRILRREDLFFKRVVDLAASVVGLSLFAPFFPIIALTIKLDSKGPVLYSQERVGRNGRIFNIYKLRTMKQDAEQKSGPVWSKKRDPRITAIGRFLRKTRIDEIPQLWNVLFNDMSLVGPRPERPHFVNEFLVKMPLYRYRTKLKPGVTGWAQVKGKYDESIEDVERKLLLDIYYLENFRISTDIKILLETIKVVLKAKGQ